jgi:hypothetical protein
VRRAFLTVAFAAVVAVAVLAVIALANDSSSSEPPAPSRSRATPLPPLPRLQASHCPPAAANCKTASGQIIYVERVDPDGDGDAHFVLTSRQSITLPGISVIDVEKDMRPRPLPVEGDRVSAAGPVYRGSYGQSQIQATELHVARATPPSR